MKILQTTRKIFKQLGISQQQAFENLTINFRFWVVFIGITTASTLTLLGLVIEANTFQEYSECFYGFITSFACIPLINVVIWKAFNMFKLIEKFEAIIAKRTHRQNMSNYFNFVHMKFFCLLMNSII